ncbi:MAG: WhiB family transcriptional regulator [Acidimicrobiales bacterium]
MNVIRSERVDTRGTEPEWRRQASCRLMPAEMFFPVGTSGVAVEDLAAAKAVCAVCDVRVACLDYAVETRQEFGIWGGADEEERRSLVRRVRQARF